jgi:hypothetical protein
LDPLLADVDVAAKAGRYVIYALAVAGGFLLGNLLTLVLCRLVAKAMFKRRMPEQLERALRVIGGLLLAALVAWLLFRFGAGWGLGGSGTGEGEGSGGVATDQTDQGKGRTPPKGDTKAKEEDPFLATGTKVTVLRASAYPKTFQFEGEPEGVDLAAAKERLRKRVEDSKGRLKFVDLLIYRNSTAETHPVVQEFESYAYELGLKTARKKLDQALPE